MVMECGVGCASDIVSAIVARNIVIVGAVDETSRVAIAQP